MGFRTNPKLKDYANSWCPCSRPYDYFPLRCTHAAPSAPICPEARELGLPTSSRPWKRRDIGDQELLPSQNLPRWEISSPRVRLGRYQSTWVWIRFRPRNHRIWPRRSSISAWSISSRPSASLVISSLVVPCPASFRNFRDWVGIVEIIWEQVQQQKGRHQRQGENSCHSTYTGQALGEVTLCPVTLPTGITAGEEPVHLSSSHQVPTSCRTSGRFSVFVDIQRRTYILEFDQPSA